MKARNIPRWTLTAMLLLLLAGSGLPAGLELEAGSDVARGRQPTAPSAAAGARASSVANAPWFKTEVDTPGDTGQHVSVAYDPFLGATYVSYYDATSQSLRIARDDRATSNCGPDEDWFCHTLDITSADVGKYSSIAVRPAGSGMGIAYHDATNGHLKYLWFENPHLWTHHIATIDKGITDVSTTGLYTAIKYSSGGAPFIAYYFDHPGGVDALMLAYPQPDEGNCGYGYYANDWQCDTIQSGEGIGQYASLALDRLGHPHIAYYDAGNGDLWYATSVTGSNCGPGSDSWTCYPISGSSADVGRYASMYVDGNDRFHIAYYDATAETLMYATRVDSGGNCGVLGSAQCDKIDDMSADYHPLGVSIAEDTAGYPVIAYQDGYGSLKVARPLAARGLLPGDGNCGPETPLSTWYCETIDLHGTWIRYRNADFASIAISPSGLATIAYNGFITAASGGNLVVARQRIQAFLPLTMRNPS
jgi:hypothetical protein